MTGPAHMSIPSAAAATAAADQEDPRVLRATSVAASQGLILRKSKIQCSGAARRYDLFDSRYDQPAALYLNLAAVEAWLGIRDTVHH